jgi:hypothetical protein
MSYIISNKKNIYNKIQPVLSLYGIEEIHESCR